MPPHNNGVQTGIFTKHYRWILCKLKFENSCPNYFSKLCWSHLLLDSHPSIRINFFSLYSLRTLHVFLLQRLPHSLPNTSPPPTKILYINWMTKIEVYNLFFPTDHSSILAVNVTTGCYIYIYIYTTSH